MVFTTATRRFFASASRASPSISAAPSTLKSTAWGPAVVGASLLAASYFYYSSSATVAAESALKGDKQWVDFKLVKVNELTSDTKAFIFELPAGQNLGLTATSALLAKYITAKGNNVIRPYTPVSDLDQTGSFELIIKRYETGKFGNYINGLNLGDTVSFQGPIPKYPWTPNKHKAISLIGGGSGITPLYQLLHVIDKNPEDKTKVTLFYGNKSEDDIILRKEIEAIVAKKPDQFKAYFFLDKTPKNWKGETGYITKEFLEKHQVKATDDNVKVFVCGPPPLYNSISGPKVSPTDQGELVGILKDLGFSKDQVFKY